MTKREPVTIELDDRSFTIRPLTLAQVRGICEVMEISDLQTVTPLKSVDFSLKVIGIGLSADYPEIRAEDLRLGYDEFDAVAAVILRQGGFEAPGEMTAAAGNASSGATSVGGLRRLSPKRRPK